MNTQHTLPQPEPNYIGYVLRYRTEYESGWRKGTKTELERIFRDIRNDSAGRMAQLERHAPARFSPRSYAIRPEILLHWSAASQD